MNNHNRLLGMELGTCTLEKLIGQGGMGSVYLAKQSSPIRYVAIKVLQSQAGSTQKRHIQRFQHEANIIAQLEHVNIIPIFEYGEQDEIFYLVMPYMVGGNLREALTRQGKFSIAQTLHYLHQITAALTYAHAHGIIHRDLKPANLLLHADGRLVLADFGIAHTTTSLLGQNKEHEPLTHVGDVLGTSAYMAPEQVLGQTVSPQTDIYTLAIIFFEMLSGDVPFKGTSDFVLQTQHIHNSLPSLHKLNPTLPAAVDVVLQKATAKEQHERYPSVDALFQALQHALYTYDWTATRDMYASIQIKQPPVQPETTFLARDTDTDPALGRDTDQDALAAKGMTPLPILAMPETTHQTSPLPGTQRQHRSRQLTTPETTHQTSLRRRSLKLLLIAGVTIILLGGLVFGLLALGVISLFPSAPTPVPMIGQIGQARQVVHTYYNDINKRHYQAAYALLTDSFHQSLSFKDFEQGYLSTIHDNIIINSSHPQADGSIIVSITINALEDQNTGEVHHIYTWQGTIVQQNGRAKINAARVQNVS